MMRTRLQALVLAGAIVSGLLATAAARVAPKAAAQARAVTIAAAGDIACEQLPNAQQGDEGGSNVCHMAATAKLVSALRPDAVLTLGDEQYRVGELAQFMASYDKTWGRFKRITRPTPGNHEYGTPAAGGYYAYFGPAAGDPSEGYYSYDLGNWHLIALNANCGAVGGCQAGSPEETWLQRDLRAAHRACVLAYWHQPRFSSGLHHSDAAYEDFWNDLYRAHADVVLNGHDHDYERFAPQTPGGQSDPAHGIVEIVAGTGGRSHYPFRQTEPNSVVRNNTTYGVLVMHLHSSSFDWRFVPEPGSTFSDRGSRACSAK